MVVSNKTVWEHYWHRVAAVQECNKKLVEAICKNEEKLQATMTDEPKELFEKYTDCVREHQTITD